MDRAVLLVQRALDDTIEGATPDPRLVCAAQTILSSGGMLSIDALAQKASMTRRHLERRFVADVGIGPKRLARITRFQRALRALGEGHPRRGGARTAAACGYADQSHFIREFRELAGCAPGEHLLNQGELTGFFVR